VPLFTTQEQELINQQSLKPSGRPYYYSSAKKNPVQITEDFEGFLILQSTDQKQKTLNWLRTALSLEEDHKDRDVLLSRYMDTRKEDADARLAELDKRTQDFIDFKTHFLTDGGDSSRLASIEEVNLLAKSLQRPLDKMVVQQEAAFHEGVLAKLLKIKLTNEQSTDETKKEMDSWQVVLSAYRGQTA
jgi:hypothetical protein